MRSVTVPEKHGTTTPYWLLQLLAASFDADSSIIVTLHVVAVVSTAVFLRKLPGR